MRIWLVNHYALPPGSTGGPTRHLGLARAMRDRGHSVTIVASIFDHYSRADHRPRSGSWWTTEDVEGITYVWLTTPGYGSTARRIVNMTAFGIRVAQLASVDALDRPDVVIGSSPHLLAPLAAQRIARRYGAPFVTEVRDIWPQSLVDLGELSRRHPVIVALGLVERYLYRTSDAVLTVLPHGREHFTSRGVRPERLHVVPNGVDGSTEPVVPDDHEGFVAVYTGTMGIANGLDVVIDAAEELTRRGRNDVRVRLVGGGPEHARLAARARGLSNVIVEPAVPATEVAQILAGADAGLLVLRDSPVFRWGISPTKLFDYMAAALPVIIAVRAPGDPATDAGASIRADPRDPSSVADALEQMADKSSAERCEMGARGRQAVRAHDFQNLAERLEVVLESVVGARDHD